MINILAHSENTKKLIETVINRLNWLSKTISQMSLIDIEVQNYKLFVFFGDASICLSKLREI